MTDPALLPQAILDKVLPVLRPNWLELVVDAHLDDSQSNYSGSYLIQGGSGLEEVAITLPHTVDPLFRELRREVLGGRANPFSRCRLRVDARTGAFNAEYGYEPINWIAIAAQADWNFPTAPVKRVG